MQPFYTFPFAATVGFSFFTAVRIAAGDTEWP